MVRKEGEGRSWVVRRSLVLQKVLSGLNRVDTISADPDERGAIFVKEKPPWWAICVVTFPASSGDLLGRGGGGLTPMNGNCSVVVPSAKALLPLFLDKHQVLWPGPCNSHVTFLAVDSTLSAVLRL
jgi:hypothetical protein